MNNTNGSIWYSLGLDNTRLQHDAKQAKSVIKNISDNIVAEGKRIDDAYSQISKTMTFVFTASAAGTFVNNLIKVRSEVQQLEVAFTTMLGSKQKADQLMREMTDFASRTPFELKDVGKGAKMLLAVGESAENVIPTLKALGDVSAGLNVPLERLILNYGQIRTKGIMQGSDLRDFQVAGVPIIAELAKNLDKTEQEIREMVSAGKIGFADVAEAFKTMSGESGKFNNLMAEQSKTLDGQISNLKDNISSMMNEIGKSGEGVISQAISSANYLVENYKQIGKIVASLIATYGSYRTAVMSVAVAQSIASQTTKGWTFSQLAQYRTLLLVEKAQKLLNATMLANPYILATTAVIGLVAVMWSLRDSTSASEKALKEFNKEQAKIKDNTQKETNEMKNLLSVIKDETNARAIRTQAYNTLISKFPNLFSKYKTEEDLLRNIEKANKDVTLSINERIRAENVKNLQETEKRKEQALQKYKEYNQKTPVTPFGSGADVLNYMYASKEMAKAQKEDQKIKNYQKKIAFIDRTETEAGFKNLSFEQKQQELEKLRELGRRRRNLSQNLNKNENGFEKENILIDTSAYEKFQTADVGYLASVLTKQLEQDQKHVTNYQKHSKELFKKMLEAKKHLESIKNIEGLTTTQIEEEHKTRKDAYEKAKKDYEDFTNEKTDKSSKNKFDNQAHLRKTQQLEQEKELAQQKAYIEAMQEGYEKELALIDFYHKEKDFAIRTSAQDMRIALEKERKDSNGQMSQQAFDQRLHIIDQIQEQSHQINLSNRQQQHKKLTDNLLKEYQTLQERKDQINQKHLEIEKALRLRYEGDILNEKLKLNEQARQKEISDLEISQKNTNSVISQMYSDLSQKSSQEIDRINERVQKLKQMLEDGQYNPILGKELGISQETFLTWQQDPKQLESLNNHIQNIQNTATSSKNIFARLGENIKKAFDAKNPQAFSEAMGKVSNDFQGIFQHVSMFSQALSALGELTQNTGLQDFASDLQNTLDVASNTLQGFAQGGLVGGGLALLTSVVSKIAEAEKRHREAILKIRQAEINQQRTLNKLVFEEKMLQKDKESVFGVKELSKAIGFLEIYRQQYQLLQNSLKKDKTATFFTGFYSVALKNISDLDKIQIKTGRVKTGLFGWGAGRDVFSSITSVYPELIDGAGKFNKKLAESILNSREFKDQHKEALQEIINQYNRMEEAQKQFDEYLKNTFGELGTSIVDSIVHSLQEGEDAFEHFAQAVGKVMGKLGKQLVYELFVADEFKKLQEKLKKDYENSKVYKEETYYEKEGKYVEIGEYRDLDYYDERQPEYEYREEMVKKTRQILDDEATAKKASQQAQQSVADFSLAMRGKMEQMRDVYKMFSEQSKALGFDIFGEQTRQAQEKGLARMSQDSADELNGQFRLMTEMQKQKLNVSTQILEKSKAIADSIKMLQQNSAQQLKHLAGIEVNTFQLHEMKKDIAGMKAGIDDITTKGIKIR